MATLIQFYTGNDPIGSTLESDRVPDKGELVELEGRRYEVGQLPHCLNRNGTPAATHWSRRDRAQSGCVGRAPGPD
jgi:hypothetical protein